MPHPGLLHLTVRTFSPRELPCVIGAAEAAHLDADRDDVAGQHARLPRQGNGSTCSRRGLLDSQHLATALWVLFCQVMVPPVKRFRKPPVMANRSVVGNFRHDFW